MSRPRGSSRQHPMSRAWRALPVSKGESFGRICNILVWTVARCPAGIMATRAREGDGERISAFAPDGVARLRRRGCHAGDIAPVRRRRGPAGHHRCGGPRRRRERPRRGQWERPWAIGWPRRWARRSGGLRGGWSDRGGGRGTEGRGGSGGPDGSARGTPTAPADLPESSLATAAAPAADDHGDVADRLRLFELLGEQPGAQPPGIDATPAGPDLTHRQERALIAKGWRGTP